MTVKLCSLLLILCYNLDFEQCFGTCYIVNGSSLPSGDSSAQPAESKEHRWNNIRLPKSIIPLKYDIFLHPNLSEWRFSGKVEIRCMVQETTDFIVLHSKDLIISDITVTTLPSNRAIKLYRLLEIYTAEQIYLEVEQSLHKDTELLLTLVFEGFLKMGISGFYLSQYFDANFETRLGFLLSRSYI